MRYGETHKVEVRAPDIFSPCRFLFKYRNLARTFDFIQMDDVWSFRVREDGRHLDIIPERIQSNTEN